ncbi:Uncharacterised protein [Mycobacteroides abscessus]|nr:Uncharacterised protein [Mycobacteroides abscessus]
MTAQLLLPRRYSDRPRVWSTLLLAVPLTPSTRSR